MEQTFRCGRSTPSDEPLMAQFHQTLSGRSVYMRYFRSLSLESRLAHERLVREVALVVDYTNKRTGQWKPFSDPTITRPPSLICDPGHKVL